MRRRWPNSCGCDENIMVRILIAECKQEVSSFNPVPSRYEDFVVTRGEAILDAIARSRGHPGGLGEVAGALSVFEERPDLQLVPTYSARAITSGGTLRAGDF